MGDTRSKMLHSIGYGYGAGIIDRDFTKNENYSEPTPYDVLSCLTKYDPESFGDFCAAYGYDTDSIKAHKTYEAVKNEYQMVCMLWSEEEMEELIEIQ